MTYKLPIYKARLSVSDLNNSHYEDYNLTLTKDLDESNIHFLSKIISYGVMSFKNVKFGNEGFLEELPLIVSRDYDDSIVDWIDLGFIGEKRLKHSVQRAKSVNLFVYNDEDMNHYVKLASITAKARDFMLRQIEFKDTNDEINDMELKKGADYTLTIDGQELWLSFEDFSLQLSLKTLN